MVLALLWLCIPVRAAQIVVDTISDADASDGVCSLREAIVAAEQDAAYQDCAGGNNSNDTIVIQPTGFLNLGSQLPVITEPLRILGPGWGLRIFGTDDVRAFTVAAAGIADVVVIENLQIGFANSPSAGGAISASDVTLQLRDLNIGFCMVDDGAGGAVYIQDGALEIYDCDISLNMASGNLGVAGQGGAIFTTGSTLEMHGTAVESNVAEVYGGGLLAHLSGSVEIDDCQFVNNDAGFVGAGADVRGAPSSTMTVRRSLFRGNTITQDNPGGAEYGGGLTVAGAVVLRIEDCVFDQNQSEEGGGLSMAAHSGAPSAVVQNTTFDDNSTPLGGTGQAIAVLDGFLDLDHVTIAGHVENQAVVSFRSGATVTIANSILYNPASSVECGGAGSVSSAGFNLLGDTTCGIGSQDIIGQDPLLEELGDNGGPIPTRYPGVNSPAIDTGSSPARAGVDPVCLPTDARGVSRPRDGDGNGSEICDRGAVEVFIIVVFSDGFESGNTSIWSSTVP